MIQSDFLNEYASLLHKNIVSYVDGNLGNDAEYLIFSKWEK